MSVGWCRTRAILFTIRTYVKPLSVFESRPALAAEMVKALEALPKSISNYKTMAGYYHLALNYLQKCAGLTKWGSSNLTSSNHLALLHHQIIMMSKAGLRRAWLIKLDPHTGIGLEGKIATNDERATNNKMHALFYIILPVIADFSDGNLLNGVYLNIQFSLANVRLGVYGNKYHSFGNKQTSILSTYPLTQAFSKITEFWSTHEVVLSVDYKGF